MSNPFGTFAKLADPSGIAVQGGESFIVPGIALSAALAGSLTVVGIAQSSGAPQSWVMNAGSSGWQACPGSGTNGAGAISFTYSNPGADAGKAFLLYGQRNN